MRLRPVSLDKKVHKYISPKFCFTPEINSKYFGTGKCVGIGQTTVAAVMFNPPMFQSKSNVENQVLLSVQIFGKNKIQNLSPNTGQLT